MNSNQQHTPNQKSNHTLDLFGSTDIPDGDGQAKPLESVPTDTPQLEPPLPSLADVDISVPRSFRVPGLSGEVLPVPVFSIKLVRERDHHTRTIHEPADVARLCSEVLDGLDREVFLAVALSTSNRVIGVHVCHVGTVDASVASPREVFKFCLLANARSVVVAHNHPSGNLEPSSADVHVSKQLKAAGDVLGIRLLDSLVIGYDGQHTSLAERGLI